MFGGSTSDLAGRWDRLVVDQGWKGWPCSGLEEVRPATRWSYRMTVVKNDGGDAECQDACMEVSINGGTPKWLVYNGKSHENGWWLRLPLFQETSILSCFGQRTISFPEVQSPIVTMAFHLRPGECSSEAQPVGMFGDIRLVEGNI